MAHSHCSASGAAQAHFWTPNGTFKTLGGSQDQTQPGWWSHFTRFRLGLGWCPLWVDQNLDQFTSDNSSIHLFHSIYWEANQAHFQPIEADQFGAYPSCFKGWDIPPEVEVLHFLEISSSSVL